MYWKTHILNHARAIGREVYDDPMGVGIELADGNDAFWVLPGEVVSTVTVPDPAAVDVDLVLREFEAIDQLRQKVIHVIRHCLAARGIHVNRYREGSWSLVFPSRSSSSLSVGASVTANVRDTRDIYAAVLACFEGSWITPPITREEITQFLAVEGPPANEQEVTDADHAPIQVMPTTLHGVLTWMGLCRALETGDDRTLISPQLLRAAADPKRGRIGQMLLQVDKRLPGIKAEAELFTPGVISLEFADGLDRFDIDTRSRDLIKRISADGPTVVGDQIADEYLSLNSKRALALRAIEQAAKAHSWCQDEFRGSAFFGMEGSISLGAPYREVTFTQATLTEALRNATPTEGLGALFAGNSMFANECIAHVDPTSGSFAAASQPLNLPKCRLRPHEPSTPFTLPPLDRPTIARLDEHAKRTLSEFLNDEKTLWEYRNPNVYHPESDTWATLADWAQLAAQHVDKEWPHSMAIVILLDAADPRGDKAARKYIAVAQPHHEVTEAQIEIVWRYRHIYPRTAKDWFAPHQYEDLPYFETRLKLGDPIAKRKRALHNAEFEKRDDNSQSYEALMKWAWEGHHWSPPFDDNLRVAIEHGWHDVAEAMENNPYLLTTLFTHDRRPDQFDEPGILFARNFILTWSRYSPSRLLAQIVATAHVTDVLGLAEAAGRAAAVGKPQAQKNLDTTIGAYRQMLADLQPALAIAWTRCRGFIDR